MPHITIWRKTHIPLSSLAPATKELPGIVAGVLSHPDDPVSIPMVSISHHENGYLDRPTHDVSICVVAPPHPERSRHLGTSAAMIGEDLKEYMPIDATYSVDVFLSPVGHYESTANQTPTP